MHRGRLQPVMIHSFNILYEKWRLLYGLLAVHSCICPNNLNNDHVQSTVKQILFVNKQ